LKAGTCTALEVEEELRAAIRACHEKSKLLRIEFSSESRMALVREVGSFINLCIKGLEVEGYPQKDFRELTSF